MSTWVLGLIEQNRRPTLLTPVPLAGMEESSLETTEHGGFNVNIEKENGRRPSNGYILIVVSPDVEES